MHASQVNLADSKQTLLEEQETSKKQSWWQKLSQSINLAGTWLFLQVLFVSHNTTIALHPNLSMLRGILRGALAVFMPVMPSAVLVMVPCMDDAA